MPRSTPFSRERARHAARHFVGRRSRSLDNGPHAGAESMRRHDSYEESTDWRQLGAFAAGIALGLALGAGAALLFAPRTGEETRELLGERARRLGGQMTDRWDDLRHDAERAVRRSRRKLRRGLTRSRWAVEDVADRR